MMEEESEVLDWGNEDDESQIVQQRASADGDDTWRDPEDAEAEDAVSLGGDEDDLQDYYAYQTTEQDDTKGKTPAPKSSSLSQLQQQKRDYQREQSGSSQKQPPPPQSSDSPNVRPTQSHNKFTHALPPKPVVSVAPFVHPSPAQTSTLASSMVQRERRSNGLGKSTSGGDDVLPPDWEVRYSRNGSRDAYYYNIKTHESTWTQPSLVSGRASPSKDRENGATPVLEASPLDGEVPGRFDSAERGSSSRHGRKDTKRKASPSAALSYEDRHYRPGGSSHPSTNVDSSERKDDRGVYGASPHREASYSIPSPRIDERRRSRSTTPPRREHHAQDRSTRSRREGTPPRMPADHGTWRESHRDIPSPQYLSERDRIPPRPSASFEPLPVQIPDGRPRGHPQQTDVDSLSVRHNRDEWPAPRNRSPPPHLREASPNLRRIPEGPILAHSPAIAPSVSVGSRLKSKFDSPANVPAPPLARDLSREHNVYLPADSVPQRRGRDVEISDTGPDFEPKRRRVDNRMADFHRVSAADTHHVSGLPQRPEHAPFTSPVAQSDQSRSRKRPPLPPQSTRFAEASRPVPPPPSNPESTQGGPPYPPLRQVYDGGAPRRYTDVSSEMPPPRRPPPVQPTRDVEPEGNMRAPPTRPSGRSSTRFDNTTVVPREPRDFVAPPERAPADIDHARGRMTALRIQDGTRANMGMHADRLGVDVQTDAPPRGPRAMASKGSAISYAPPSPPIISPKTSYLNLRPMPQEPAPSAPGRFNFRFSQQLSQPPLAGNEGWAELRERQEPPSRYPKGPAMNRDTQPRKFDEPRNTGLPLPPDRQTGMQEVIEPKHQDMQDRRFSRRDAGGPPLPVSGTNSVPIGNRNALPEPPIERPPVRPPNDRGRPSTTSNNDSARGRPPHGNSAPQDEFDEMGRRYRPTPDSPVSHYRIPPVVPESPQRRPSIASESRSDVLVKERPPPAADTYQNSTVPTRPRIDTYRNAEGRPRVSRFGPQTAPIPQSSSPAVTEQPRVWITREQSMEGQNHPRGGDQPEDFRPPSNVTPSRIEPPRELPRREEPAGPPRSFNDGGNQGGRFDSAPRLNVANSPRKRQRETTPERGRDRPSPAETRTRGRRTSLEGRLSSHYDEHYADTRYAPQEALPPPSLPVRPPSRDIYPEMRPRAPYNDHRGHPPPYRVEAPLRWDRPDPEKAPDQPTAPARLHPDRARLIDPVPAPSVIVDVPMRTSKPVRIRRPPPMSAQTLQESFTPLIPMALRDPPPSNIREDKRGGDMIAPLPERSTRPSARRGGSLLDRLSMDHPSPGPSDVMSPSLRERVETLPNKPDDNMGGVPPDVLDSDYEMNGGGSGGGDGSGNGNGGGEYAYRGMARGGKRRGMKPKRGGRRGGVLA